MRAALLTVLIAAAATPALAQPDPSWIRERNAAAMANADARRQAQDYQRETRAREQRARTQEVLRSLSPGELAGGPGAASATPYRPSSITPDMPPPRITPTPPSNSADAARADELMAQAMARSQARVRAATGQTPR
ncbi:MAG: hypothetical protein KA105_06700 [Caulobacter sp.]|nr:hypothetical protein [Caulobacter sp.]